MTSRQIFLAKKIKSGNDVWSNQNKENSLQDAKILNSLEGLSKSLDRFAKKIQRQIFHAQEKFHLIDVTTSRIILYPQYLKARYFRNTR